jgi:glycosyltransferase involved in cell wall biosynthesis
MKVLFLAWRELDHPLAGGSEVLIDQLASGLVERGHQVSLLCGGPVGTRPYRTMDAGGTYSQYIRAPFHYARHFRDHDVVIDVANGIPFFAPTWRSGASLCFVNHVHTAQWDLWFSKPMAAFGRFTERRLVPLVYRNRMFVAVSPSTAAALEAHGVRPEQIRIVPNGMNAPDTTAPTAPEPLFVAVGRLVPHKRVDLLLRAWDRVRPNVGGRLVIVGDGPERARLESLAGPGVHFAGRVTTAEKERLLGAAWALMHPSLLEGWGLVVMEAAVHGTPTLGFDVPGVRDSVVDGRTGLLAATEDAFVWNWQALAGDPKRRDALGRAAKSRAALFSWKATADRFEVVAMEAVEHHRSGEWAPRVVPAPAPLPVVGTVPVAGGR